MKKILYVAITIILLFTILAACSTPEQPLKVADLLELGEKYLLELDYEQALVQFLTVIEVEPMNPRGYTGATEAYIGLGQIDSAIFVLQEGLRAIPGNADIMGMIDLLQITKNAEGPESVSNKEIEQKSTRTEELGALSEEELPEGFISVEGVIILNSNEYIKKIDYYNDLYKSESVHGLTTIGRPGIYYSPFGVRFLNVLEYDLDGESISIHEALLSSFLDIESIEALSGQQLRMIGTIYLNENYTEEISGPFYSHVCEFTGDEVYMRHYFPNGKYTFYLSHIE